MANDLYFQNISTVQSNEQPLPVTIVAAATVAPTTFLSVITGTTAINTITPPVTGTHLLAFIFTATNPSAFGTTGNIDVTAITTPATNSRVTFMVYNPVTAKYFGGPIS